MRVKIWLILGINILLISKTKIDESFPDSSKLIVLRASTKYSKYSPTKKAVKLYRSLW